MVSSFQEGAVLSLSFDGSMVPVMGLMAWYYLSDERVMGELSMKW